MHAGMPPDLVSMRIIGASCPAFEDLETFLVGRALDRLISNVIRVRCGCCTVCMASELPSVHSKASVSAAFA